MKLLDNKKLGTLEKGNLHFKIFLMRKFNALGQVEGKLCEVQAQTIRN